MAFQLPGFTQLPMSPPALVGSYPTLSPLPRQPTAEAVYFLLHLPSLPCGKSYPLGSGNPCAVRTFLFGGRHPPQRWRRLQDKRTDFSDAYLYLWNKSAYLHVQIHKIILRKVKKVLFIVSFLLASMGGYAKLPSSVSDEVYAPPFLKEFNIYPNPTSGLLTLTMETFGETQSLEMKVYSLIGQEMYHESISPFAGFRQISVDLGKFPKGIYMLEISNGEKSKSKRISVI
jgi:Secretion system C-terminal sorting domain